MKLFESTRASCKASNYFRQPNKNYFEIAISFMLISLEFAHGWKKENKSRASIRKYLNRRYKIEIC